MKELKRKSKEVSCHMGISAIDKKHCDTLPRTKLNKNFQVLVFLWYVSQAFEVTFRQWKCQRSFLLLSMLGKGYKIEV